MKKTTIAIVFAGIFSFGANAWMTEWAPEFECKRASLQELPQKSVSAFLDEKHPDDSLKAKYSQGAKLDLNDDGVADFVFIVPWMGCGLCASGYDVHFVVSDGAGGRKETVLQCFGADLDDFVKHNGKTYFRHSFFFNSFEHSDHNHWVYQLFSFPKDGSVKCANAEAGKRFPAATIYYSKPKFKQVELTKGDLKQIEDETGRILQPCR